MSLIDSLIAMKASPMSDEFHDWLDECPVRWIRDRLEKEYVYYCFEITDEENDEQLPRTESNEERKV